MEKWEMNGGRFDFDDGGTYVGGWEEGKAHGHGVCTGPQSKGEYAGAWHYGFEVSGVYTWPSGNTYQGQWQNGKRHGLGMEQRGRWVYKGEWTQGYKGRYGVRQSTNSHAKYQGTWSAGFNDGYGTEIYADGGSYQGQWLRGMRHGYGIRKSTTYVNAEKFRSRSTNHASLTSLRSGRVGDDGTDEQQQQQRHGRTGRAGFVLRANSTAPQKRRRSLSERSLAVKRTLLSGLRIKKQHSTGDIHQRVASMSGSLRSSGSTMSCTSEDSLHHHGLHQPEEEAVEDHVTEMYQGEWKNDVRSGFGVCERSDGLRYQGEWANNAKCGYGVTTFKDGSKEEGRYKNNVLQSSSKRKGVFLMRASKYREKLEQSVGTACRAASIAQQKADIAASRTSTARERSEQAHFVSTQAKEDSELARIHAKQFDPNFKQPGTRRLLKDSNGGESFGTDLSDAISYSRHLSQTHSKQHSFEQTLSVDMAEDLTPPSKSSTSYHNHVPNTNHVNFMPQYGYNDPQSSQMQTPVDHIDHPQPNLLLPHSDQIPTVSVMEEEKPLVLTPPHSQQTAGPSNLSTQAPNTVGSRFSLSDDHYDQYVMAGGNSSSAASSSSSTQQQQQQRLRRNRPSLMRQADVNESSATGSGPSGSSGINRRSTLASRVPLRNGDINNPGPIGVGLTSKPLGSQDHDDKIHGSLPNVADLEVQGVRMRREEVARMAGQRRQEVLRENEEQALLRANPLRHLLTPAFRAMIIRWRIPILLTIANLSLMCLFYNLLTYEKKKKSSG